MNINEILRQRFPNERTQDLADELGWTYSKLANRAYHLGLRKSEEFKMSDKSGRHNLIEAGKKTRFKKGHTPANKGKNMDREVYEKCKATMWKPGHKPKSWKPDGTITNRTDKSNKVYKYYKIKDSHWILYHHKVWTDYNGPIPSNHIVTFKDGNSMNCDISNLELITMAENAIRNSIQRFPKELQQLIKLKAKLKKKINGKKQNQ